MGLADWLKLECRSNGYSSRTCVVCDVSELILQNMLSDSSYYLVCFPPHFNIVTHFTHIRTNAFLSQLL